ncbi:MAG: hypothetical protein ACRET2_17140, partial [Steroidobacteraceae bacterium]
MRPRADRASKSKATSVAPGAFDAEAGNPAPPAWASVDFDLLAVRVPLCRWVPFFGIEPLGKIETDGPVDG